MIEECKQSNVIMNDKSKAALIITFDANQKSKP